MKEKDNSIKFILSIFFIFIVFYLCIFILLMFLLVGCSSSLQNMAPKYMDQISCFEIKDPKLLSCMKNVKVSEIDQKDEKEYCGDFTKYTTYTHLAGCYNPYHNTIYLINQKAYLHEMTHRIMHCKYGWNMLYPNNMHNELFQETLNKCQQKNQ